VSFFRSLWGNEVPSGRNPSRPTPPPSPWDRFPQSAPEPSGPSSPLAPLAFAARDSVNLGNYEILLDVRGMFSEGKNFFFCVDGYSLPPPPTYPDPLCLQEAESRRGANFLFSSPIVFQQSRRRVFLSSFFPLRFRAKPSLLAEVRSLLKTTDIPSFVRARDGAFAVSLSYSFFLHIRITPDPPF